MVLLKFLSWVKGVNVTIHVIFAPFEVISYTLIHLISRVWYSTDHRNFTIFAALNARWAQLRDMVDLKRAELSRAHRMETFRIDCQETVSWIEDKTRVLEDTEEMTGDLTGVMRLQRKLSMM